MFVPAAKVVPRAHEDVLRFGAINQDDLATHAGEQGALSLKEEHGRVSFRPSKVTALQAAMLMVSERQVNADDDRGASLFFHGRSKGGLRGIRKRSEMLTSLFTAKNVPVADCVAASGDDG